LNDVDLSRIASDHDPFVRKAQSQFVTDTLGGTGNDGSAVTKGKAHNMHRHAETGTRAARPATPTAVKSSALAQPLPIV
jgi:hypothetical protein